MTRKSNKHFALDQGLDESRIVRLKLVERACLYDDVMDNFDVLGGANNLVCSHSYCKIYWNTHT